MRRQGNQVKQSVGGKEIESSAVSNTARQYSRNVLEEDKVEVKEYTLWSKELKDPGSSPVVTTKSSLEELKKANFDSSTCGIKLRPHNLY